MRNRPLNLPLGRRPGLDSLLLGSKENDRVVIIVTSTITVKSFPTLIHQQVIIPAFAGTGSAPLPSIAPPPLAGGHACTVLWIDFLLLKPDTDR
jgi:hypothetical protein